MGELASGAVASRLWMTLRLCRPRLILHPHVHFAQARNPEGLTRLASADLSGCQAWGTALGCLSTTAGALQRVPACSWAWASDRRIGAWLR